MNELIPSMSNHVLFLTYHLPVGKEPGAFRPWMEARLMSGAGYRVTVVTSGVQYMTGEDIRNGKGMFVEEELEGARIIRTWAPTHHRRSLLRRMMNYLSYSVLAGLASLVKVGKVDRLFAGTDPIFMMPVVYLVSLLKRAPMVLDERDLFPETAIAMGVVKPGLLTGLLMRIMLFLRRRAYGVLAATPGIRRELLGYGLSEETTRLIYNADPYIDMDTAEESERSLRGETGRSFLVGYLGGLGLFHDIPTLLKAAQRLQDHEDLGVVIIGSGERRAEYERFVASEGLDNVFFMDPVARNQARRLMSQMDVCVHLFPDNDFCRMALGSKTFDYLGRGVPMVFSGEGDTAEILEESGGGLVVPPERPDLFAEALLRFRNDPELKERMGRAAGEWYRENISVEANTVVMAALLAGAGEMGKKEGMATGHEDSAGGREADRLQREDARIREVYASREAAGAQGVYQRYQSNNLLNAMRLGEATRRLLGQAGVLVRLPHLEMVAGGCGGGQWLGGWQEWGADPRRLHGFDLLEDRIERATQLTPHLDLQVSNGRPVPYADGSMDVVHTSTVFSSILDPKGREALAAEMMRVRAKGGGVLVYDFRYSHPRNPNTIGIGADEVRRLFPELRHSSRLVTLAPPISRRLAPRSLLAAHALEALVPPLRSHQLHLLRE